VDNTLYTAAAKGAERIVKIPVEGTSKLSPLTAAALYASVIQPLAADLVLVGVQAHDELDGVLATALATALARPYVGVIRGVQLGSEPATVVACKEFPRAVRARMVVQLPAVLGILGADQPPRYVPVSRIRAAMNATRLEEPEVAATTCPSLVSVRKLYPPVSGTHAEMIAGSETEVADRIVDILLEKGLLS
jgi:electron transfer flavoprotein beta subunit